MCNRQERLPSSAHQMKMPWILCTSEICGHTHDRTVTEVPKSTLKLCRKMYVSAIRRYLSFSIQSEALTLRRRTSLLKDVFDLVNLDADVDAYDDQYTALCHIGHCDFEH
ncbi:hypothetical protein AcW1_002102 [Taiwanofungus camphoratus]|nr:hypothetical protein AcW1_002102 [Antrodia cinnamomea]